MSRLPVAVCNETDLLNFDEATVAVNERIAVVDLHTMQKMLADRTFFRTATYCFLLLESGECEVEINRERRTVSSHTLVCGIPGDSWIWHASKGAKGKLLLFEASFPLAGLRGGYSLEPISFINSEAHNPYIPLSDKKYKRLRLLIADMKECIEDTPVFWDLLRAQLWEFIFLTEKECIANGNYSRKNDSENRVHQFINLVNRYYRIHHDLDFYAESLNVSPSHLNKTVKATMGKNAREIIFSRLLSEAKILLRLTETSVSEIAYKLGFDDPNYFIRYFKKVEGMTPGEYQKLGSL